MSSLSNREKVLIYIVCILVVGYLFLNFLMLPQIKKLQETNTLYENNRNKLYTLQAQEKNLDNEKKSLLELEAKSKEAEKSIPDTGKVPEIILDIKNITESSGCKGGKMSFSMPGGNDELKNQGNNGSGTDSLLKISINYQIEGNNDNIVSFLKNIENSTRKMTVDKIQITHSKDNKLSADLNINCFYIYSSSSPQTVDYPFIDKNSHKVNMFN